MFTFVSAHVRQPTFDLITSHCFVTSTMHLRHLSLAKSIKIQNWTVGGVEISILCNHRVTKQSKAGPLGAESSTSGESTMLSANFAEAIRCKHAGKNCFLFVCGLRFWDLRFQDTKNPRFYAATKMKKVCHGHDCRKIEGSSQKFFITEFHFAKDRFSFRKVQISFRKVQIFISQVQISFRFVSQSTISPMNRHLQARLTKKLHQKGK